MQVAEGTLRVVLPTSAQVLDDAEYAFGKAAECPFTGLLTSRATATNIGRRTRDVVPSLVVLRSAIRSHFRPRPRDLALSNSRTTNAGVCWISDPCWHVLRKILDRLVILALEFQCILKKPIPRVRLQPGDRRFDRE